VYTMLPISLDCPFLVTPSVFCNVCFRHAQGYVEVIYLLSNGRLMFILYISRRCVATSVMLCGTTHFLIEGGGLNFVTRIT
jgi:hypothetical protein